jgi:hypothetical protein
VTQFTEKLDKITKDFVSVSSGVKPPISRFDFSEPAEVSSLEPSDTVMAEEPHVENEEHKELQEVQQFDTASVPESAPQESFTFGKN